jgi:hypothetical protein
LELGDRLVGLEVVLSYLWKYGDLHAFWRTARRSTYADGLAAGLDLADQVTLDSAGLMPVEDVVQAVDHLSWVRRAAEPSSRG